MPDQRPWNAQQVNHYPYAPPVLGAPQSLDFKVYRDFHLTPNVTGMMLPLGSDNYFTTWRIVAAERIFNGETLFTLKATNAFDILSEINRDALPKEAKADILAGVENVIDAALKYSPVSTVDVCREFARLLVAAWLRGLGRSADGDLGTLIKNVPGEYKAVSSTGMILTRLHSRGKSSEQERQANTGANIRPIADADGDLSIALIGFLLRDFGWTS